ncbi:hypothetical protein [Coraliomargarita parva]|uniref:hypothetical protein n=1 Tax=Coraliomargarita parva TaxID=3014050 RepID=UPI0022B36FF8|nr:hypothetical protein [Coraliomargarita parva]
MDISKHNIVREAWQSEIGLLLGNGEMGGLLRNDGLGFDAVWLTDFWSCDTVRAPVGPFRLSCSALSDEPSAYRQELSLHEAVARTELSDPSGASYKSQCFFSETDRHLMVFQLENTSSEAKRWTLSLPGQPVFLDEGILRVVCSAKAPHMGLPFTSLAWTVKSSLPLEAADGEATTFLLEPGQSIRLVSALVTSFDCEDFSARSKELAAAANSKVLLEQHLDAWAALWGRMEVSLPDGLYATTFYRSLYYTLSITGASRFIPGVCQFADPGWGMIPFSNDAGYVLLLLSRMNQHERATAMLKEFYKPEVLRQNARNYLIILEGMGTLDDVHDAFCFSQMLTTAGTESNFTYGRQRHLDGFMPAIFHRNASLHPEDAECEEMAYQVLRGCSVFWQKLLFWDEASQSYMIRKTLDLDENTFGVSMMSSVIACRWTLMMFARYARRRNTDLEMAEQCEESVRKLYWPENSERYLARPGDAEGEVGSKYFCIRSFSTLGYPYCEQVPFLDLPKAHRTLDKTHARNKLDAVDAGVNAMTTGMYALTEASLGRSEEALKYASLGLRRLDPSGAAMGEAHADSLFYCSSSYSTFALTTIEMLLQSYDNVIHPFPAVPEEWKDLSFKKLPADGGILVSGEMRDGRVTKVRYEKNGQLLLETSDAQPVEIRIVDGATTVVAKQS